MNESDDYWSVADVAEYLHVRASTIRAYVTRKQMPPPDRRIGHMSVWRPATITEWRRAPASETDGGSSD